MGEAENAPKAVVLFVANRLQDWQDVVLFVANGISGRMLCCLWPTRRDVGYRSKWRR